MICGQPESYVPKRATGPQALSRDHNHACCPDDVNTSCGKCLRSYLCRDCNTALSEVESYVRAPTDAERIYLRMWELIHCGVIPMNAQEVA